VATNPQQEVNATRRVPLSEVKPGMYVVGLDRSWIDTPFLFHRKLIKDSDDIELFKKHGIREVVIDPSRSVNLEPGSSAPVEAKNEPAPSNRPAIEVRSGTASEVSFRILVEEFEVSSKVHDEALSATQSIFDGAGRGAPIPAQVAKKVVSDITGCILRSPDASLLLTQMRRFQNDLFAHAVNVCVLSLVVGAAEGLETDNPVLGFGALLHDVGQTRLPRNLLRKTDLYTDSERRLMEQHPTLGLNVIQRSENIPEAARLIVAQHHERVNGTGYPAKLKGDEISIYSQIVAITDAYDSMLIGRSHSPLQPIEVLRQIYIDAQGGAFDRSLVEKVIRALGVYPIGSLVELNTGERGIVIAANRVDSLKPTLRIVAWPGAAEGEEGAVVSLAEPGPVERKIVRVLDPGKERIDIMAHLQLAAGNLVS